MHTTGNLVADTICRTAEIGLTITDAADAGLFTAIDAAPVAVDDQCPGCEHPGVLRDHVTRQLVDLPVVGFPTRLHVRVPRFTCANDACGRKIFQASLACADDGAKLTRRVTRWILPTPGHRSHECLGDSESPRCRVAAGQQDRGSGMPQPCLRLRRSPR